MFEAKVYAARRAALAGALRRSVSGPASVLFLGAAESPMNYAANVLRFRQDSSFLYFFGLSRSGLAATIDVETGRSTVYGDEASLDDLIWTGPVPSLASRSESAGADICAPRAALASDLAGRPVLYLPPYRADARQDLASLLGVSAQAVDTGASVPLIEAVVALREIKSDAEVERIEAAVAVTLAMHRAALSVARPGLLERDLTAELTKVALSSGGDLSFPVIATVDGSVLHSLSSTGVLEPGKLVLVDAGAETEDGYAGDLTTTFPVSPRFDSRQREVYAAVLAAHRTARSLIKPGVRYLDVHLEAAKELVRGLKALGLMRGDPDEAVAEGAHALFFPHGLGHQLGLDVHDMEGLGEDRVGYDERLRRSSQFGLRSLRMAKELAPGMALTVEPGLYFIGPLMDAWKAAGRCADFIEYGALEAFRGFGGVRIEEDWLVLPEGGRRLGPGLDLEPEALEACRA